jgi:hypothetical protein
MSLAQGTNNENRRAEVDDCKKQGEQMFDAMLMM